MLLPYVKGKKNSVMPVKVREDRFIEGDYHNGFGDHYIVIL